MYLLLGVRYTCIQLNVCVRIREKFFAYPNLAQRLATLTSTKVLPTRFYRYEHVLKNIVTQIHYVGIAVGTAI